MATTIPCMRGRLGSIEYYVTTMKAGEVIRAIRVASELEEWDDMTIEERMQRDLNWKRIEDEIARYMATDPDRFYGALLVAIYNDEGVAFEPLSELQGIPRLYENAAKCFGFLHLEGGEMFFALDGQHRLKGTEIAITGLDHNHKPIQDFIKDPSLATEDIPLILFHYAPSKRARKIFNKVNKYAKATSKGDNIITSEDDAFAVIARWLMGSDGHQAVIPQDMVNWTSNTLTERMTKFTTVSTLYEAAKILLQGHNIDTHFRPDDQTLEEHYEEVKTIWGKLLSGFQRFKEAMAAKPHDLPTLRRQYIVLKPVGQLALIWGVQLAREHKMPEEEIVKRLNKLPWEMDDQLWLHILTLPGGKVQAGKTPVYLAGRLIAYLIGTDFAPEKRQALQDEYIKALGGKVKALPTPVA